MHKPRIAILGIKYFPSRDGVSRVVENTIAQLTDEFEITVYCYTHPEAATHIPDVNVVTFPQMPFGALGVFWSFWQGVRHVLKHGEYDLVHVHKTDAAFFLPMLCRKFKVLATSHEAPYKRDKWSRLTKEYFRWMEKLFIQSPAKLTSISSPLSAYYEKTYGREVQYIPNSVEVQVCPDYEEADKRLCQSGIKGPFIFFAAHRIMATKGAHHLLKALSKANYQGNIVIAGDTEQLPQYTRHLLELARGLNVHFLGFIEKKEVLMALIKRSSLFVFPSETEGMSIMLLEVASMEVPIIASDIPENTAIFQDEDLLFFRNKDTDDLAEKFQWALRNPHAMHAKATQAHHRVSTEYNSQRIAEQYAGLYRESLGIKISD